jgi:low temperature requirement protein LtrA
MHGCIPLNNVHLCWYQELFFDLIFVASVIQLAGFVKHETSVLGVYHAFIVFCMLWLTWLHMTFLANRFQAPLVAKVTAATPAMAHESGDVLDCMMEICWSRW